MRAYNVTGAIHLAWHNEIKHKDFVYMNKRLDCWPAIQCESDTVTMSNVLLNDLLFSQSVKLLTRPPEE